MTTASVGVVKLLTGVSLTGAAVAYGLAVIDGTAPIPSVAPDFHTMVDGLVVAIAGWVVREIKELRKPRTVSKTTTTTETSPTSTQPPTPAGPTWQDVLLEKLEDLALGTQDTNRVVKKLELDFVDFRADTRARLSNIESHTGEIRRA